MPACRLSSSEDPLVLAPLWTSRALPLPCAALSLLLSLSPSSGQASQVSQGSGRLTTLATERGWRGRLRISQTHASQPTDKHAKVVLQSPLESGARAVLGHVTSFLGYHLDIFRSGSRANSMCAVAWPQ